MILPLGQGDLDLTLLKQIRDSGYNGPIGILNHTNEDAELRLQDNLNGLTWVAAQLDGTPPGPKPEPRSWMEPAQLSARMFDRSNLAAWCIVPYDAKKRGSEERAAMLEKIGVRKFVYDWRTEHKSEWDEELSALKRHHIELLCWWFPTSLDADAKAALELFKRHGVKPQLWVSGGGGPVQVKDAADQKARIAGEVGRLTPIALAAREAGCTVGLYNHGGWFGEPENVLAIIEALKAQGITNVGIVYNMHHGHAHLARLERVLARTLPHLLCLNLNGMDIEGDSKGRKILPLGAGTEDLRVVRTLRDSGYRGPIGILNHTGEDAEARLLDNIDGLNWIVSRLNGKPSGAQPEYRSFAGR
jgi:sugar phosphate isomerase/epimerase